MSFEESYIGKLRKLVGSQMLQVPGTRAILENSDGEILLQLRSDYKIWGLPAGSPELGDDIRSTMKREVQEETGLVVDDLKAFGFASSPEHEVREYPNGDKIHNYSLCFFTHIWKGELDARDESLDLRFFNPDSLPKMISNHKRTIESYLRFKESGEFQFL